MKILILTSILFIGYDSFLYPQFEGVFVTEPEIDYDLYYETCDILRDSMNVFFTERITHIPKDYEKEVKVFFTAEKDGKITDIEFDKDFENDFNDELAYFLKKIKFDNSFINNFIGDSFNVRMSIAFKYIKNTKCLDIAIDHYTYWKEDLSVKDVRIRKLKPEYNRADTITFDIINYLAAPLYFYISVEGKLRGQLEWIDSNVWDSIFSQNIKQFGTIESKDTISIQLFAKDLYERPDFYRIVTNYGFKPSAIDEKYYSYSFTIK